MNLQEKVAVLKALADGSRLRAVSALAERSYCVEELAQRLGLSPSTMSFHLRKLEAAELVEKRQSQYYALYTLRPQRLTASLGELVRLTRDDGGDDVAIAKEERRVEQYRDKVVRAFFRRGKLAQLPKQWKKRVIVAEEFLKDFEAGRDYSEKEISERIAERFADSCTIRRILVDEGHLRRSAGVYRVVERQPAGADPRTQNPTTPRPRATVPKQQSTKKARQMTPRSELKRQYKEAERQAGVFQVKNTVSGRVFLGSSLNLHGPLNKHRFMLKSGLHSCAELQKDYREHGAEAFVFEVLAIVEKSDAADSSIEDELARLEAEWLERLQPVGARGYNRNHRIRE